MVGSKGLSVHTKWYAFLAMKKRCGGQAMSNKEKGTCLDCRFAEWWESYGMGGGVCSWGYQTKIPKAVLTVSKQQLEKKKPFTNCPCWEKEEGK
jgi:hypothetical protein